MENYLTQITNYLLTQSWHIAVLVVVIAAVNLVLKNKSAHIRYLLWLIALAIFDIIIPLPLTAALMMFVVLRRPSWFREMVSDVYEPAP